MAFEVSVPTVDSQVVAIRTANPDIFLNIGTPKFAAQAIKKVAEMNWHPIHIMTNVSISPAQTLKPAGVENSTGILSSAYQMIVTDPAMEATPGMKKFRAFMEKYFPGSRQVGERSADGMERWDTCSCKSSSSVATS